MNLHFQERINGRNIYLFIYLWLCWVFVAVHGLSLVAVSGVYSSLWCVGFSLRWLLLLRSTGSRHAGSSSCGTWAQQLQLVGSRAQAQPLRVMWDLPGPGLEHVSRALAGGFLTTEPSGKLLMVEIIQRFQVSFLPFWSEPRFWLLFFKNLEKCC